MRKAGGRWRVAGGVLGLALLVPLSAERLAADSVNRIVLRVNDQIATLREFEIRRDDAMKDLMRREKDPDKLKKQLGLLDEVVFRNMFEELLLNSRADQLSIEESEPQVDQAETQMRENAGLKSDQEFQAALGQSAMTEKDLREMLRRQLRERDVMGKDLSSRIKVKDEELRAYYRANSEKFRVPEQLKLREVVILEDSGLTEDARIKLAADIRAAVTAGKGFSEVVESSAAKGWTSKVVDFGWVTPGDLDKTLETAAWKLPNGQVSDPIHARGGTHLLQVVDRRPEHVQPFSEVQNAIMQHEQQRRYQEESVKYMDELEQRALIFADPPAEAANFRHVKAPSGPADTAASAAAATATATTQQTPSDTIKQELVPGSIPAKPAGTAPPKVIEPIPPPEPPPSV
ncbi:MAG TPA: peptidyl-prolyl cis-trans isomerase [Terriglobia bacterium]|nr:peptidyl-prolyl cis-trans isomerase [Terriglobia bacterium]